MRYLVLLALALLFSNFAALGQMNRTSFDDLNTSALQYLVIDSSAGLESYRFSMEMEQKVDLINITSGDVQKLETRSFGYGMANMSDRALKLSLASLTHAIGDEDNNSAIALMEYLVNDTVYMKMDGNWTAMKMPGVSDAWSAQSTMAQQLKIFNQSRISLIGSEMVEGIGCYKVRAEIDMGILADQLSGEVTSLVPIEGMNYSELFRNLSLDVYYWISKDTHLLKKTDVTEVYTVAPQSLDLSANESGDMEMRINSDVSMLFEGFNESVNIKLPAEAKMAPPFPMGLMVSAQAVPAVPIGHETMTKNDITQSASTA
jgi:hypothetical protein